jgi:hypothetical protein
MKINKCTKCSKSCEYDEFFDAYFCKKCNIWNEKECGDSACKFCASRPKMPSEIEENLDKIVKLSEEMGLYE